MSTLLEMRIEELEEQNAALIAERDALAAQVEWFGKAFIELRDHHVANFHLEKPFIGNLGFHENWKSITEAISAQNGVLHSLIYKSWLDGFEASNCGFNGEYSEDDELSYVLAKCFADGVAKSPVISYQQHLAEIRAEAGRDGFVEGLRLRSKGPCLDFEAAANQYADQIRRGEVE